jgi:ADP-ribose pyrophosphatase
MELREKTLESKRIYDGKIVNLRLDTVELPNGKISHREVVEHRGAVAIVPLLDTDTIVLIRQFRQPTGEVILEIPAGTLERGEDPDDCASRELTEEIGYAPGTLTKMFSSYLAPGYSSEMLHTYLASHLQPVPTGRDADEFMEIVEVKLGDAVDMIVNGEIKDAKTICGVLMAYKIMSQR